ncbi:Uncharacterised protein [Bordetella pertussis]|nr:Uncharacterised protein [Bordetella pertussis]
MAASHWSMRPSFQARWASSQVCGVRWPSGWPGGSAGASG